MNHCVIENQNSNVLKNNYILLQKYLCYKNNFIKKYFIKKYFYKNNLMRWKYLNEIKINKNQKHKYLVSHKINLKGNRNYKGIVI